VRSDDEYWERVETYIKERTGSRFSHGICPDCFDVQVKQLDELLETATPPDAV
jgi:hypothetical protein